MARRTGARRSLVAACGFAIGLLIAAGSARADKIDVLTQALLTGPSYRVKVQAALTLGKLKARDPRAVQALIEALRDDNEAVRVVAAQALGKLGDASATDALRAAAGDSSPMVRSQAARAVAELARGGGGGGGEGAVAGPRFLLAVSDISPGKAGAEAAKLVHDRVVVELGKLPRVTLDPAAGAPNRFFVDGNITNLDAKPVGAAMRTECDLRMIVATYPEKSIKMMATVGGAIDGTNDPSDLAASRTDCLRDAAKQIAERVKTFLDTQR